MILHDYVWVIHYKHRPAEQNISKFISKPLITCSFVILVKILIFFKNLNLTRHQKVWKVCHDSKLFKNQALAVLHLGWRWAAINTVVSDWQTRWVMCVRVKLRNEGHWDGMVGEQADAVSSIPLVPAPSELMVYRKPFHGVPSRGEERWEGNSGGRDWHSQS